MANIEPALRLVLQTHASVRLAHGPAVCDRLLGSTGFRTPETLVAVLAAKLALWAAFLAQSAALPLPAGVWEAWIPDSVRLLPLQGFEDHTEAVLHNLISNDAFRSALLLLSTLHDEDAPLLPSCLEALLLALDARALLTLLDVRTTPGSILPLVSSVSPAGSGPPSALALFGREFCVLHSLPRPLDDLRLAFERPHSSRPSVKLSVGARALSKHAQRSSDGWWGEASGPEARKNATALTLLHRIVLDGVWFNVHCLPV